MALKGKAKTDYMREYMRKRRAAPPVETRKATIARLKAEEAVKIEERRAKALEEMAKARAAEEAAAEERRRKNEEDEEKARAFLRGFPAFMKSFFMADNDIRHYISNILYNIDSELYDNGCGDPGDLARYLGHDKPTLEELYKDAYELAQLVTGTPDCKRLACKIEKLRIESA